MQSTVTTMTVAELREALARGNLIIDSDLNRGTAGATVWSDARKAAFVKAKCAGLPSQNITLVKVVDGVPNVLRIKEGQWKVIDGRNRLLALLDTPEPESTATVSLILELICVPTSERDQLPVMFTALNNGGIPLTPGEALLMAAAPELATDPLALSQLAYKVWGLAKVGRGALLCDQPDPGLPESIIVHSLWKIRDAIHGPGRDQGNPTLVSEHSELFGPGGRRDREQGFSCILSLLEFVAAGSNEWETIALAFGAAAHHVVSLGERVCILSTGSICTNVHDKAWLPGNAVIELLLSQSLCPDNPLEMVWWRYFAAFLDRCQATSLNELWIQGLIHYEMQRQGHGVPARRRAAGEFSSFVRQNCVDHPRSQRPGRTCTYYALPHVPGSATSHYA